MGEMMLVTSRCDLCHSRPLQPSLVADSWKAGRDCYNIAMPYAGRAIFACLLMLVLLGGRSAAQQSAAPAAAVLTQPSLPPAPASNPAVIANSVPNTHAFWDRKNALLFAGVGVFRVLDYASTRNMRDRGRQEILLSDGIVDNKPLFLGIEAAATGLSIGIAYVMHRTGHHKLERLISIAHISGAAFGDVRNYALKSGHTAAP